MSKTTLTVVVNEKNAFILYYHSNYNALQSYREWIRALKRQNKDKTEWKPSESDRVCSIHFAGSAYERNSVPTLNLGYEVEEKKAIRTLIKQSLPKKGKIKKNNDADDEDDVVPLPISATVTESQPTVTCSTP